MKTSIAKIFSGLTPEKHCTESFAENEQGHAVKACSPFAVKWCALGWIEYLYPENRQAIEAEMKKRLNYGFGTRGYIEWQNDDRGYTFIEELRLMDKEFEI
ncbi:MAG: hypothetical protein L0287_31380 [Anaerolineae bacterium]|nr:hypothetical protein [Anaerolineae bacterium]